MHKSLRIAFGYKAGSGKTTASNYLQSMYGGTCLSFADDVYKISDHALNIMRPHLKPHEIPEEKDRDLLRLIGMWGRSKSLDVWVNSLMSKVNSMKDSNIFIGDVRFFNEFYRLKSEGFVLVKIVRPISGPKDTHISETELDCVPNSEWDYVVHNSGTLEEFKAKLETILKRTNQPPEF